MHKIEQRGSDIFKMPGIPRTHIREKHNQRQETLHQSKQVWPLERFSSQRSPWLAATTLYSLQGQTLSRRLLHSPPDSCFNSSNTAWKYETNHQDFASADEETVVIFKENQFKPFWCVLRLVHTCIETQNELMICGEPLTERKVTVIWEGTFFVRSSEFECFDLRAQESMSCTELQWANCWWNPQCVSDGKNAARAPSAQIQGIPGYTVPLHHVRLVQGQPVNRCALRALEFLSRCNLEKEEKQMKHSFCGSHNEFRFVADTDLAFKKHKYKKYKLNITL